MKQSFRNFGTALVMLSLVSPIFAQQNSKPKPTKPKTVAVKKPAASKPKPEPTPKIDPAVEKERFEAAVATASASEKAELLVKFIADLPKSEFRPRAEESLAGARAAIADERLSAGDLPGGLKLFRLAIEEAPKPFGDRLFSGVLATIPANLWVRGYRAEGVELARLIESYVANDAKKLLQLGTFYLGSENGDEAKRIAEAAIKLDESSATAYQLLASAQRLNFDLEAAAASFAKAAELAPDSTLTKRSLADVKRAIGKSDEAEALYREILAANEKDNQARSGLALSLFDQGKRADAEAEMAKALEEVPANVALLAGAAYWYAANSDSKRAIQYAEYAIEKEPRHIWSHIALARGLVLQGKPVEAERVLINARKLGNFPTLQYEIASARYAAGFFREAVEELKKSFTVKDGVVITKLGGRVESSADSFTAAVQNERRASIFSPKGADDPTDAARLKALLEMSTYAAKESRDPAAIVAAAESFSGGADNMAVHRKLYAANLLLQNDLASDEAMKLVGEVVVGLDKSLDVPNAGAAVMANELYEARNISFSRDDFLLIPDVPRQTLISLMRGKVEETTGLALLRQGKAEEASVRFRRALTVLPKDSAWWRSATWNLGTSLAAEGKEKEALDTLISSYAIDKPNAARYIEIERLWIKVNGSREGLEKKIGPDPLADFSASASPKAVEPAVPQDGETSLSDGEKKIVGDPSPTPGSSPATVPEIADSAKPSPTPELSPTPGTSDSEAKGTPTPEPSPSAGPEKETTPSPTPEPSSPRAGSDTEAKSTPTPEVSPSPDTSSTDPGRSSERSATPSDVAVAKADGPPVASKKPGSQLFEPIVISIPRSSTKATTTADKTQTDESSTENRPGEPKGSSGEEPVRPRVVEGKAITGELLPCEIGVSQESISLMNNGGSIAVLVSIEEGEDIGLVTGAANRPSDIEVRLEPELVPVSGRVMYVIKSLSDKTGLYQVTFKAPCGKKVVNVRVR